MARSAGSILSGLDASEMSHSANLFPKPDAMILSVEHTVAINRTWICLPLIFQEEQSPGLVHSVLER